MLYTAAQRQRKARRIFTLRCCSCCQVEDFCAYQLSLDCKAVTLETAMAFAAWVSSHSNLVGSLSWAMPPEPRSTLLESQKAIATALQQAAASPAGLQLQRYSSSCPTSGAILAVLPCRHLTSLGLCFQQEYEPAAGVMSVLSRLTNLRTLKIQVGAALMQHAIASWCVVGVCELCFIRMQQGASRKPSRRASCACKGCNL